MESGFLNYMNRSLRLVRLFGIYPLYHTYGSTRLSPGIILYNIATYIHLLVGCIWWAIQLSISYVNLLIGVCIAIVVIMPIVTIILWSRGCKKIGKIFCMIEATEVRLSLLGICCSYGQPPIFYPGLSLICVLLGTIFNFLTFKFNENLIAYHYFHSESIIIFNLFGFATLLRSLEVQFSCLSNQLLWMLRSNVHIKMKEKMMESIIEIHEELFSICHELSKFYSAFLLLVITSSFMKCISHLYCFIFDTNDFLTVLQISYMLSSILQGYNVCSSVAELGEKMESGFLNYMNRSLRLVRLFGIYPLYHTYGSTRLSPGIILYNVVTNIHLLVGCIWWAIQLSMLSLINAIIALSIAFVIIMPILTIILWSRGCKKIGKIFCMIRATEARLSLLGIFCSYGRPPVLYSGLSLICLSLGTILRFSLFPLKQHFIMYYVLHYELIIILNLFGFATLLRSLEVQFSSLSNQLLWMRGSNVHIKMKLQMMESVIEIHEELCSICHELSKFYSVFLLLTTTAIFIKSIALLYCLFRDTNEFLMLLQISCILLSLLEECNVCSSVAGLGKKAKEFNMHLYQLMIEDNTNVMSENKKLRLHFYMKREVVFSACGFFNLDYPLIHSMVNAATTHLVILIQLSQLNEYRASIVTTSVNPPL